ncbi:hypothetical protein EV127DRAFT_416145 [Xylaria flabelliformis]|nr:hypothetical protein EV127DRAFT_416145 [Xylaria flabelliformis]
MILAPVTNFNWRYREKTVFNIALENGLEVTRKILEVLKVWQDPERNDSYLHWDKTELNTHWMNMSCSG